MLFGVLTALCSLPPALLFAQVDTAWVRRYNGPGNSYDYPSSLAVDGQRNVYVTGCSIGSDSIYDCATIKYNPSGVEQWVARYNGPANYDDYAEAIAVDGQRNVYVTGESYGSGTFYDYVTIKYNANGVLQWVARYNGPGNDWDVARSIAIDVQRNVYVTGESRGSGTDLDYATIKYNSSGVEQWVRRYNGPGNDMDWARSIAIDVQRNVYVTGYSNGSDTSISYDYATIKYNFAGAEQWVARYNGPGNGHDNAFSLTVDGQGNVYVTGLSIGSGTYYDFATVKYNTNGVEQWVARYNGPGNDWDDASSIAVDGQGNVYVTGTSYGSGTSDDYATIKYNSSGVEQWVARYNGPANEWDMANSLTVDGQGNVYVTGIPVTIKYNSSGVEQWVARYNGQGNANSIALDGQGNVYITGCSYSSGTAYDYATIKYVQTGAVAEELSTPDASRFTLNAEPNPFSSHTAIRYSLSANRPTLNAECITLKLYDISGRLAKTLVDEYKNPGNYQFTLNTTNLSAGVYFLSLQAEEKRIIERVIIIK